MRREMQNPKFCNYVWGNGLSIEDAYYLCHREEQNYGDSQYRSRGESRPPKGESPRTVQARQEAELWLKKEP